MPDPKVLDNAGPRIPDEWRREYRQRPPEKLANDVTLAFDRLWKMEREKDQLRADLTAIVRYKNLKIWILGSLAASQTAIIAWLVNLIATHFTK